MVKGLGIGIERFDELIIVMNAKVGVFYGFPSDFRYFFSNK